MTQTNKRRAKGGRPSRAEIAYIRANAGRMRPEAMADHLERRLDWVLDQLRLQAQEADPPPSDAEGASLIADLERSAAWRQLQTELTAPELAYFREEYVALVRQFKSDLLHAERTQVFKAIKYDILMQRCLAQQRKVLRDIDRLERDIEHVHGKHELLSEMSEEDKALVLDWDIQLQKAYKAKQDLSTEYVKLEEKHQRLMEALKATRDQRVTQFESANTDFLGVIKWLYQEEAREREDRQQALMKKASDKERERLTRPATYADGVVDVPLLTPETVLAKGAK